MKNILFITMLSLSFGTVTDIDGNVYETVLIGEQLWMAENLKVTKYRDGSYISSGYTDEEWFELETGAYTVYPADYDDASILTCQGDCSEVYGNLYNWYAVGDEKGICPEGWHVPTDAEWMILTDFIAPEGTNTPNYGSNTIAGGKMKECTEGSCPESEYWNSPNDGATNESGFTVLPIGFRSNATGYFSNMGNSTNFWTSTQQAWHVAYARGFYANFSTMYRSSTYKSAGYGIRCIADEITTGCTDPSACNYDETATADDGSCAYEYDCEGICGGNLELDCCGVCGGDNSQCSTCCGSPFYDDCTDDCFIDVSGVCCYELEVNSCGMCGEGCYCNQFNWEDWYPNMQGCDLEGANLNNLNLTNADLTNANLGGATFFMSDLEGAALVSVDAAFAMFPGANLTNTNLSNAELGFTNFMGANLTNANLSNVELQQTNLNESNLNNANFTNANCMGTSFINATLEETNFEGANLIYTYFDENGDTHNDVSYEIGYDEGYTIGFEDGILLGGQSGDSNGDGVLDILDIVYFVDVILNP